MILDLKDICKIYQKGKLTVPVLKDVCLQIEEGDYVAIMGPSGSGKTTLMNIIGCLDKPSSGSYQLAGESMLDYKDKQLSKIRLSSIGFVFQNFQLMPRQTALDNVALPLLYAGIKKQDRKVLAAQALERVGLGDRMNFKPTQLSGGQCQRVAIARAIVNNPKILLADEPTGALDTASGIQIMELFRHLNKEGMTIIMITHAHEVAGCAKRTEFIRDGQIVSSLDIPDIGKMRPESTKTVIVQTVHKQSETEHVGEEEENDKQSQDVMFMRRPSEIPTAPEESSEEPVRLGKPDGKKEADT